MDKTSLGDRMKSYEDINRNYLIPNIPVIIRIDGKAFHSFTKGMKRPFDNILIESMNETAKYLCKNISGCKMAYIQSDEISLLITDYDTINTEGWFKYNIQKMVSVSASMATLFFNNEYTKISNKFHIDMNIDYEGEIPENIWNLIRSYNKKQDSAMFDSRVFQLPKDEVCNYFIWRQQDCVRNSIQSVAFANFSPKQVYKKNCDQLQEMLWQEKNINWNNFDTHLKRGRCVVKEIYLKEDTERSRWVVDNSIPIFTQFRSYVEKYVYLNKEQL